MRGTLWFPLSVVLRLVGMDMGPSALDLFELRGSIHIWDKWDAWVSDMSVTAMHPVDWSPFGGGLPLPRAESFLARFPDPVTLRVVFEASVASPNDPGWVTGVFEYGRGR